MHTIRLATVADLPTIRAFWRAYLEEARPPYPIDIVGSIDTFTRNVAMALTADPPTVTCFLAIDGDVPVGFVMYEIQTRIYGQPERIGFVHYCYVDPNYRHLGVGIQLLTLAAEHAMAAGLSFAEMTVIAGDHQWDDLGWVPCETRYYIALPAVLAGLQHREQQQAARHGNGLDRDEVPTLAISRAEPLLEAARESDEE